MPRLTAGPFRYKRSADRYLEAASRYARRPLKQAVISPSALSLMYPADGLPGYSREQFIDDLLAEHENEIRRCFTLNQVCLAHDGIQAVEEAERFQPDVVLMDMGMPRLNGYDATRRIREQPWGREMIIVALTGWGQENDKARSSEAGCNDHLVKPIDLVALEKILTKLRAAPGSVEE